ncbi:General transcription factor II-I repeat domain-containing protein 2 [Holothuria leucospilota]|uniref:General transcription factor II-I repeat domain-containing protein 2 n=1 Tax=Holothuria leucospilota TaxID=206669 RepID=A0A9Q0YHB4_HOLLE|nr:General transcription factor II-I repeat domain-containing protein 2 [Holothuria leucospilota]
MTLFLNFSSQLIKHSAARGKDAAYLSDIFDKLNEVNLKLQGEKMNLIKAKGIITAFMAKLTLFRNNIGRYELYQFPSLQTIMEADDTLSDNDLETYCAHLDSLMEDMQKRFTDLSELRVPDWVNTMKNA